MNIVLSVGQKSDVQAYADGGCRVLIMPAFELISGFPVPKFWTEQYRHVLQQAKDSDPNIIITRTRFFSSSVLGGLCAKLRRKQWVHIEHGSAYVKLNARWKNILAQIYDQMIGRWIFKKADGVV